MNGIKRFCLIAFGLAGVVCLCALIFPWAGPFQQTATALMSNHLYQLVLQIATFITGLGLVVTLLRGFLTPRQHKTVVVDKMGGDQISVTTAAISSQAAHIVEGDGTLSAEKVSVNAKKRGGVSVDVRVRPRNTVDVTDEGRRLHDELSLGLASLCGDKVKHINLEFVEADSAVPAQDVSIEMLEIPQSVYERAALQDGSQQSGALDGSTASSPALSDGGTQSYEVEGEGEQQ